MRKKNGLRRLEIGDLVYYTLIPSTVGGKSTLVIRMQECTGVVIGFDEQSRNHMKDRCRSKLISYMTDRYWIQPSTCEDKPYDAPPRRMPRSQLSYHSTCTPEQLLVHSNESLRELGLRLVNEREANV